MSSIVPITPKIHTTGFWEFRPLLSALQKNPLDFIVQCQKQYGSMVYANLHFLRLVVINDPIYAKELLQTHHQCVQRPSLLKKVTQRYGFEGILSDDGERWKSARKALNKKINANNVTKEWNSLSAVIENHIRAIKSGNQSVLELFSSISLDVVFRLLYNYPAANLDAQIIDNFYRLQDYAVDDLYNPFSLPLWVPSPRNKKINRLKRQFFSKLQPAVETIASRQNTDHLQISQEMTNMLIAGMEATANMMSWAVYRLGVKPELQQWLLVSALHFWK